jgi:ZIP family zinc transporter
MGSLLAAGNTSGAMAFLFALAVTNGSQSMMSGTNMSENHGDKLTMAAWTLTALVVGGAVIVGYIVLPSFPRFWISAIEAFAGGAVLASLAGEIYPDAYEQAGPYITFATAVGFLGTFLL